MCFSKFVLGLHLLILYFQQTYGSISSFGPIGPVASGRPLYLACQINAFNAGQSATLTRNGSLINTCFQSNVCTEGDTKTINGVTFTFSGDSEGIYVLISSLPESEIGLLYVCDKDGPQEYMVSISTTTPSTTATTTTTPTTLPTTATTPSTSSNTCIFFKEKQCVSNYFILILICVLFIVSLFGIGFFIKRARNQRQKGNTSNSGIDKNENNPDALVLHYK